MIKTSTKEVYEVGEYAYTNREDAARQAANMLDVNSRLWNILSDDSKRAKLVSIIEFIEGSTLTERIKALSRAMEHSDNAFFALKCKKMALERQNQLLREWSEGYPNDCS